MKLTHTLLWLLAGLIIIGLTGWIVTGLLIYARMAYLSLLLVVGSGIWTYFSIRGIRMNRQARTLRASVGDIFEEHFEVQNTFWWACPWVEIINQSNLPLAGGSRLLTGIGPHQRRFYTARTLLSRRGAFLLGPTKLSSGDPFGLFTIHTQSIAKDMLVVLPMTVPIRDFSPPPGLLPGGRAIHQKTFDVTPHAAGVREYVPGDPMKRIHWPSTAHRGRYMVKEFEQDPQADIWLFIDSQKDVQAAFSEQGISISEDGWWLHRPNVALPSDSFEYITCAAASLASYFLLDRRVVGLACATGKITIVSAERGQRQFNKIMETLAFLKPDGRMSLLGLVMIRAKFLPVGTGVILITPSTHPELLLAVEDLQRRNLRPVVVLIKPETFGGKGESDSIASNLVRRNVPVCLIGLGDDFSIHLALSVNYLQSRYKPAKYSINK
jgi:uncharacterized protein (DUF58 family)